MAGRRQGDLLQDQDDLERRQEKVERSMQAIVPIAVTTFVNGWRNIGGGGGVNQDARYWRDGLGIIHVDGMVDKNGGNWVGNETIFTLPAGFRPLKNLTFTSAMSSNGFTVHNVGHIDVLSSGAVGVGLQGGAANPVSFASLAGISFVTF